MEYIERYEENEKKADEHEEDLRHFIDAIIKDIRQPVPDLGIEDSYTGLRSDEDSGYDFTLDPDEVRGIH